jgi:Txe/YoeB family toxin of Txe-Axe toxin-antitoxin module
MVTKSSELGLNNFQFLTAQQHEPLKHNWSMRINSEHRIAYKATDDALIIVQYRYHY